MSHSCNLSYIRCIEILFSYVGFFAIKKQPRGKYCRNKTLASQKYISAGQWHCARIPGRSRSTSLLQSPLARKGWASDVTSRHALVQPQRQTSQEQATKNKKPLTTVTHWLDQKPWHTLRLRVFSKW